MSKVLRISGGIYERKAWGLGQKPEIHRHKPQNRLLIYETTFHQPNLWQLVYNTASELNTYSFENIK